VRFSRRGRRRSGGSHGLLAEQSGGGRWRSGAKPKQRSRGTAVTIKHGEELSLAYKTVEDIRRGEKRIFFHE